MSPAFLRMRAEFLARVFGGVTWGDAGLADLMARCSAVFAAGMADAVGDA